MTWLRVARPPLETDLQRGNLGKDVLVGRHAAVDPAHLAGGLSAVEERRSSPSRSGARGPAGSDFKQSSPKTPQGTGSTTFNHWLTYKYSNYQIHNPKATKKARRGKKTK